MLHLQNRTHFNRYRQIAEVLLHHGMGYLLSTFGLERFMPLRGGIRRYAGPGHHYTKPEHVRVAIEELGATFIKLGQFSQLALISCPLNI